MVALNIPAHAQEGRDARAKCSDNGVLRPRHGELPFV
jgi:hypothetical protein